MVYGKPVIVDRGVSAEHGTVRDVSIRENIRPMMRFVRSERLLLLVLLVYGLYVNSGLFSRLVFYPGSMFNDFTIYWTTGRTVLEGGNPYAFDRLPEFPRPAGLAIFIYPPITLPIMALFASLPQALATGLYALAGILMVARLIWLWRDIFGFRDQTVLFAFFAPFALNSTILTAWSSGNITIFEQVILWTGIAFLLRGRVMTFLALVYFAGLFKFVFLGFAGLPLLLFPLRRVVRHVPVMLLVLASPAINLWLVGQVEPQLVTQFYDGFPALMVSSSFIRFDMTHNVSDQSLLTMIYFLRDALVNRYKLALNDGAGLEIYVGIVLAVWAGLVYFVVRLGRGVRDERDLPVDPTRVRLILCLFCLAYLWCSPVLRFYQFIMGVPCVFYLIRHFLADELYRRKVAAISPLVLLVLLFNLQTDHYFFLTGLQAFSSFSNVMLILICLAYAAHALLRDIARRAVTARENRSALDHAG